MYIKQIVQFVLLLLLLIILYVFYAKYFNKNIVKVQGNTISEPIDNTNKKQNSTEKNNGENIIKNLKYEVTLFNKDRYIIESETSELFSQNNLSILSMKNVLATIIGNQKFPITISSNKAMYNNLNYDTNFRENVIIKYKDNLITADKMDLSFKDNLIKVYDKVVINGEKLLIKTDIVQIDLITKKINISMIEKKKNVEILTKENVKY